MNGLTWENPSVIGFVVACYQNCAIENADLQKWAEHILGTHEVYPPYILELLEYDGSRAKVSKTLGFYPPSVLDPRQSLALSGIGYVRGLGPFDDVGPKKAIAALQACPEVLERFRETFPFVSVVNAPQPLDRGDAQRRGPLGPTSP